MKKRSLQKFCALFLASLMIGESAAQVPGSVLNMSIEAFATGSTKIAAVDEVNATQKLADNGEATYLVAGKEYTLKESDLISRLGNTEATYNGNVTWSVKLSGTDKTSEVIAGNRITEEGDDTLTLTFPSAGTYTITPAADADAEAEAINFEVTVLAPAITINTGTDLTTGLAALKMNKGGTVTITNEILAKLITKGIGYEGNITWKYAKWTEGSYASKTAITTAIADAGTYGLYVSAAAQEAAGFAAVEETFVGDFDVTEPAIEKGSDSSDINLVLDALKIAKGEAISISEENIEKLVKINDNGAEIKFAYAKQTKAAEGATPAVYATEKTDITSGTTKIDEAGTYGLYAYSSGANGTYENVIKDNAILLGDFKVYSAAITLKSDGLEASSLSKVYDKEPVDPTVGGTKNVKDYVNVDVGYYGVFEKKVEFRYVKGTKEGSGGSYTYNKDQATSEAPSEIGSYMLYVYAAAQDAADDTVGTIAQDAYDERLLEIGEFTIGTPSITLLDDAASKASKLSTFYVDSGKVSLGEVSDYVHQESDYSGTLSFEVKKKGSDGKFTSDVTVTEGKIDSEVGEYQLSVSATSDASYGEVTLKVGTFSIYQSPITPETDVTLGTETSGSLGSLKKSSIDVTFTYDKKPHALNVDEYLHKDVSYKGTITIQYGERTQKKEGNKKELFAEYTTDAPTKVGVYRVKAVAPAQDDAEHPFEKREIVLGTIEITKATPTIPSNYTVSKAKTSKAITITPADLKLDYVEESSFTVKYYQKGVEVTPIDSGTYTAKVTIQGDDNYNDLAETSVNLKVYAPSFTRQPFSQDAVSKLSRVENGENIDPSVNGLTAYVDPEEDYTITSANPSYKYAKQSEDGTFGAASDATVKEPGTYKLYVCGNVQKDSNGQDVYAAHEEEVGIFTIYEASIKAKALASTLTKFYDGKAVDAKAKDFVENMYTTSEDKDRYDLANVHLEYAKQSKAASGSTPAEYETATENAPQGVGTYKLIAVAPAQSADGEDLADYVACDIELGTFEIKKATPTIASAYKKIMMPYTGGAIIVTPADLGLDYVADSNLKIEYTKSSQTADPVVDPGTYTAKVTINGDDNYSELKNGSFTLEVYSAAITKNGDTKDKVSELSKTYDNKEVKPDAIENFVTPDTGYKQTVEYKFATRKDDGTYDESSAIKTAPSLPGTYMLYAYAPAQAASGSGETAVNKYYEELVELGEFTIYSPSFGSNVVSLSIDKTYDGKAIAPSQDDLLYVVPTYRGEITFKYAKANTDGTFAEASEVAPKDVGKYKLIAVASQQLDDAGNILFPEYPLELGTFEITKATPSVKNTAVSKDYTGKPVELTKEDIGLTLADNFKVAFKDAEGNTIGTPVNAGTCTAVITVAATENTETLEANVALTINKATVTLPYDNVGVVYTGNKVVVSPEDLFGADTLVKAADMKVEFAQDGQTVDAVAAGTYSGTVTIADNANIADFTGVFTLTVDKATPTYEFATTEFTYTGEAPLVVVNTLEEVQPKVVVEWFEDEDTTKKLDAAPLDAGTYYAVAKSEATANFEAGTSAPTKIVINKATQTITFKNQTIKYTGKAVTPKATTSGDGTIVFTYYKDAKYKTKIAKTPINAGKYYVIATAAATTNYKDATAKATVTIAKYNFSKVTITSALKKTFKASNLKKKAATFVIKAKATYGKTAFTKGFTFAKVKGSKNLTINKKTGKVTVKKGTKAGKYTIQVKVTKTATAKFNAKSVTKTFTVTVTKK